MSSTIDDDGPKSPKGRRVLKFIESLMGIGSGVLMEQLALPREQAEALMDAIAKAVVHEHAKTYMYVPAWAEIVYEPRNQRIWREYGQAGADGTRACTPARIDQLATQYGLTWRHIYRIVAYMQARENQARQMSLLEP